MMMAVLCSASTPTNNTSKRWGGTNAPQGARRCVKVASAVVYPRANLTPIVSDVILCVRWNNFVPNMSARDNYKEYP